MRFAKWYLIALLLVTVPLAESARRSEYKCSLMSTWMDSNRGIGGGWYQEGEFFVTVGVSLEEPSTIRTFKLENGNGMQATVEIRAVYCERKPCQLVLTLNVAKESADKESPEYYSGEVSTKISYGGRWKQVSVSKDVLDGGMVYSYELWCERQ